MRDDDDSWADLCRLPHWFCVYLLNFKQTEVVRTMSIPHISSTLGPVTVTHRVYFLGERVIGHYEATQPRKEVMSFMASPNFYNKRRFSGVLVRHPHTEDNTLPPSYYFGEAR